MTEKIHRDIIETFRISFICGCISREEIISWADEMILIDDDYDFIEISMAGKLPYQDFESLLLNIGKRSDHFNCLRKVLGRMAVIVEKDQSMLRKFAKGLYSFVTENTYELPGDMNFLTGLDDEYALAENGTYGSLSEVDKEFISELNTFKSEQSTASNWYSAPLHTS